MIEKKYLN